MDVSIIIVNYNTRELTRNCLSSIYEQTKDIDFEVFVSDNGSTDGSVEMIKKDFPQVNLIENNENLGFGAANNRALKFAKGKYIFYLNSDTVLLNNAVKMFFDYWKNSKEKEKIGALGSWLLDEKENVIHSGGKFPSYFHSILSVINCVFRQLGIKKERRVNFVKNNFHQIDYVIGADLFLLNNSNAFFDEQFFMYSEEVDLQFQLEKKNLNRFLICEPKIIHFCGGSDKEKSSKYNFAKDSQFYYWSSLLKYFKKNDFKKIPFFILKNIIIFSFLLPCNVKKSKIYIKDLKRL